jgi:hypothetical protein
MDMLRRLFLAGLVLAVFALPALADAPRTGVVTGTVVGPDGAALPGATVVLVTDQGDMTSTSNENGEFRFVFIAPGEYTVRVDMPGFQQAEGLIQVSAGGRAAVELRLSDAMGEEIVVTGETPLVNKFDVTGGGTVSTQEMTKIPGVARFAVSQVSLMPGITNDFQSQRYFGFNPEVEGNSGSRNNFFIDGVDVTFPRQGGGTRLLLPAFASQELKLEATAADAQYGRMIGGVVSTTLRSGSNQFHGELVYYARNLEWDDNYEITPVLQPDEIKDSYEISLAGPIVKDKMWFFVSDMERNAPVATALPDGSFYDASVVNSTTMAKLDFRPSDTHTLAATYVETPFINPGNVARGADLASTWLADWGGEVLSLSWDWAINDSLFLETKIADQTTITNRVAPFESVDPSADPWKPAGNNYQYQDLATRLFWNGCAGTNVGDVEFPRSQFNTSLNWFSGVHDVKVGLDYQKVKWRSNTATRPRAVGQGYSPDSPGGFLVPLYINFYYGSEYGTDGGWSESPTENTALFVRDRMSFDKWTFNLGLRYESQQAENDAGDPTVDATGVYPRLSAVYDIQGDGKLLLSATAGRYMYQLSGDWASNFNTTPTGRNSFDRFAWNPATQAYDTLIASVPPSSPGDVPVIDTNYKDEITLGLDWAFHRNWAFTVKGVYWENNDTPTIYNQQDATGAIVRVVEKNPWATAERSSFHLTLNRRFRNNWMMGASYTYSSTEGTCWIDNLATSGCVPQPGELIDVVDPVTGVPLSLQNYDGPLPTDRPNVFKLRGMYLWQLGKGHSLNLGGFFSLQDGTPWALTAVVPVLEGAGTVTVYQEPRGSNRTPRQKELNLNAEWQFPIYKGLVGALRLEAVNATNEQVLIGTVGLETSGRPTPTSVNYQRPRFYRIMARITF